MHTFEPRNLKAYICAHIFEKSRPVLLVAHEEGDWIFACGKDDHETNQWHVVGVGHLIDRDATLNDCANLQEGYEAERNAVGGAWIRNEIGKTDC
jgi:hypothetical protein